MNNNPIGIFDSGLGGLTILKQVRALMPREDLIYFGDSAHVPYGSKSKQTVMEYSINIAKFLEAKKVKLILIACNTASALALPAVQRAVKVPVLGVITPGAKAAAKKTINKKILVLGTESTVKSNAYPKAMAKALSVKQQACPLFVPLIEEGLTDGKIIDLAIKHYLEPLKNTGIDTVILGCTHYPVIKKKLQRQFGAKVRLVDSATEIAAEARALLSSKKAFKNCGKATGKLQIYASDSPERFSKLAARIIGGKLPKVKVCRL